MSALPDRCVVCKDTDGMVSFRDPDGYAVGRWKRCDHAQGALPADRCESCAHYARVIQSLGAQFKTAGFDGPTLPDRLYKVLRRVAKLESALRHIAERQQANYEHGVDVMRVMKAVAQEALKP